METYKAEMLMRDIPEERWLGNFVRIVVSNIHNKVLQIRATCPSWEELEGRLFERYGLDDSLWLSKREFMEWFELPRKGRNTPSFL